MFEDEKKFTTDEFDKQFWLQRQDGLWYTVKLSEESIFSWSEVHVWCQANTARYSWNGSYFHFKTKDEAVQFRLLWG